jgi:hypothetical protein
MVKGGKLSVLDLKNLLTGSYEGKDKYRDYVLDKDISTKTSKVYVNPKTNQTVVAHKGTEGMSDWYNNAVYTVGGIGQYKKTDRYKEAKSVQDKAGDKYGNKNITTIGHSQGGLQADLLGREGYETITYNKPRLRKIKGLKNNYDIRTSNDPVSYFGSSNDAFLTIPSKTYNPVGEHSITKLQNLDKNLQIGRGMYKFRYARH